MPKDLERKTPPQSLDAEMALLGAMLIEKDAIIKAIDCFFDDDEHYGEEATEDECEITWEEEV